MGRTQPIKILLLTVAFALGAAALAHAVLIDRQPHFGEDEAQLERLAGDRFIDGRGLSPCERAMQDVLRSSRYKLFALGEQNTHLLLVVAPTFSGPELVTFRHNSIKAFKFAGQSGFVPPSDWFPTPPQLLSNTGLGAPHYNAVLAPISRHIRDAMT